MGSILASLNKIPVSFDLRKWVTGVGQTCQRADEVALTVEATTLVTTSCQALGLFCVISMVCR